MSSDKNRTSFFTNDMVILFCLFSFVGGLIGGIFLEEQKQKKGCTEESGIWVTARLTEDGTTHASFEGPDLTELVMGRGCKFVYTYYDLGEFEQTSWEGYRDGKNVWRTNGRSGANRSIDLYWPDSWGEIPEGTAPGTSAR